MQAHEMDVLIPEDRQLTIEVPETFRSGPARLILLIPSEDDVAPKASSSQHARGRMAALYAELATEPRSFQELSGEERRARLRRVRGIGRGLLSTSEEFAKRKREEIEIEERKFGR